MGVSNGVAQTPEADSSSSESETSSSGDECEKEDTLTSSGGEEEGRGSEARRRRRVAGEPVCYGRVQFVGRVFGLVCYRARGGHTDTHTSPHNSKRLRGFFFIIHSVPRSAWQVKKRYDPEQTREEMVQNKWPRQRSRRCISNSSRAISLNSHADPCTLHSLNSHITTHSVTHTAASSLHITSHHITVTHSLTLRNVTAHHTLITMSSPASINQEKTITVFSSSSPSQFAKDVVNLFTRPILGAKDVQSYMSLDHAAAVSFNAPTLSVMAECDVRDARHA